MSSMSEQQTPPRKPRANKVAEEKARLRAEIAALTNKVPEFVNSGSVQATRQWVAANEQAQLITSGGKARLSRAKLDALVKRIKGEAEAA